MKQKRYVIALLLAAVVISGVSYVSAEAHNTIGETPVPTQNPNITVTVEVGPTPHYEYINMPTELPATYTPDWKPGDWWNVISYAHPPSWPGGWGRGSYKYEVVKCEVVVSNEGKQRTFYKVKKTSTHYYADPRYWTDYYFVRNDTLNTLSLYRVESHGYDRDNKTLDVDEYGTIDYPAPVMSTFMGVTLSVPVFPLTTERSEESYEFVKGRTPIRYPEPPAMTTNVWRIKQEVSVNETGYKGNGTKPLPIPTTISGHTYKIFATTYEVTMTMVSGETVTQYWHPSAPWALYEHSTIRTVHLTGWGSSEQPEEVSVVSEENSSEWWVSEPEEENSEPVKGVIYRKGMELAKESSEPVKGVTYRKGSVLSQKSSVPVKGVTYRKGFELPQESSASFKGIYLPKK